MKKKGEEEERKEKNGKNLDTDFIPFTKINSK